MTFHNALVLLAMKAIVVSPCLIVLPHSCVLITTTTFLVHPFVTRQPAMSVTAVLICPNATLLFHVVKDITPSRLSQNVLAVLAHQTIVAKLFHTAQKTSDAVTTRTTTLNIHDAQRRNAATLIAACHSQSVHQVSLAVMDTTPSTSVMTMTITTIIVVTTTIITVVMMMMMMMDTDAHLLCVQMKIVVLLFHIARIILSVDPGSTTHLNSQDRKSVV